MTGPPKLSDALRFQRRLRFLSNATHAFAEASRSSELIFDTVVREVAQSLDCVCTLSLLEDDGAHFNTVRAYAVDPDTHRRLQDLVGGQRRVDGHPGVRHVVETGTPLFAPYMGQSAYAERGAPEVERSARDLEVRSAMVVPLLDREKVIGTLGLARPGEGAPAFDEDDLALALSLAQHAVLALATARVFEQAALDLAERTRLEARLGLLADSARDFSEATGDYVRLLAVIARRVSEGLGALCAIRAVSEDGLWLELGEVYHHDAEAVTWVRRLSSALPQRVGEGVTGRVAASGQPLFMPRLAAHEFAASAPAEYREFLERLDVRSVLAVPMVSREKVVGVAMLLRSRNDPAFTESDLHLVQSVVHHGAIAISNARSYQAEREARAAAVSANEALKESEEAQRLLFDSSPMPLLVYDVLTIEPLAVNDAALRLYGYTRDEFMRLKVSTLAGASESEVRERVLAMPDREVAGIARYVRKDGTPLVAEYTTRPLSYTGRRARITALNDVTARSEAERTSALLAAIVESSNEAILSERLDGTITSWNRAAQQLFGYTATEAVGSPITLIMPADRVHEEQQLLGRVGAGERVDLHETVRRRKDGTEFPVAVSLAPIRDAAGTVVGASKAARDLSAQRATADALKRTEEQLRQAQKMDAVGRLAGGISHDFNNLLSVILSYSDLIGSELGPTDPLTSDLAEIRNAALSAAALTRQLLVFSRQQIIEPRVLDLNEIVTTMDKMLRRILGEDVDLVSSLAPQLGSVLADPSGIEQVIMNLALNARDAMPRGGKLTIETGSVELDESYAAVHWGVKPGPHIMLAVSDTGTGMEPEIQARIFEPFFTTKETGKGTGLGLSIVFGIAQQAGGSVWVYSEPGKGTTFKVYLPRSQAKAAFSNSSQAPISLHGGETILLAEDQEQVRTVVQSILRRHGYRVLVAQNAGEALLLCEAHPQPIHLLLTDVVMPLLSGAELAKRIAVTRAETKVLYMSGYTDDSVVRHGVLEDGVAFLQKPFTPESLARKVREVLDGA
ncbi:MAG TPA: PAS domain S-box protein [Polyangiaceae bacterium]|nr:PAS domain S-box protein [Polyangiaceae bacterium]